MFISITDIRSSLEQLDISVSNNEKRDARASVAIILTLVEGDLSVCFIKRAMREGDPWSGQVALPGGRAGAGDQGAASVAERETKEEIGMVLLREQCLGGMIPIDVASNLHRQELVLSPYVYFVGPDAREEAWVAAPSEVDSVFWVPMAHLFDARSATQIRYPDYKSGSVYPGIGYQNFIIWGLTLRILRNFGGVIGRNLPH